jgi:Protein of unknown function (DUF2889)
MTDSIEREEIHHRQLDLRFFKRSDGLFEVEGHLIDRKAHAFRRLLQDQDTPAGAPLHDIRVRLVVDDNFLVHEASATLAASPFDVCRGAANTLTPLVGLRIGSGWNKQVRELLRGAACCTHIVELLGPMATTAYQGMSSQRIERMRQQGSEEYKAKIDSCYAYAGHRDVVARLWPNLRK